MSRKAPTPYSFGSCHVQDGGILRVIAQIDELVDAGATTSRVMKWVSGNWTQFSLEWSAIRVCQGGGPPQIFVLGPDGEIVAGGAQGKPQEENVDATKQGPSGRGPLRDLRWMGNHL